MSKSVWYRAAELVEETDYGCCDCLQKLVCGRYYEGAEYAPEVAQFAAMFKPEWEGGYWYGFGDENRTARILALLLMDAMEADQ